MERQVSSARDGKGPYGQEFAMADGNRRLRRWFAEFDIFSAFMALLCRAHMEPKPIPVKARRRR